VPLAIALVVVFALVVFLWVAFGREEGPGPVDVAVAYEHAWLRADFDVLFDLSGDELRDGMRRERFVEVQRATHAIETAPVLAAPVAVEEAVRANRTALVVTRVGEGSGAVRNNVVLEQRASGWTVVGYSLRPGSPAP
jgi:hypothetical protein